MRFRVPCFLFILVCSAAGAQTSIPKKIDSSGKRDVTRELNEFFESVPDGGIITFPNRRQYRVEGVLRIRNKKNISIKGNGSTIVVETTGAEVAVPPGRPRYNWPRSRDHLSIEHSTGITITGLNIRGPHKEGGLSDKAYVKSLEAQHGVNIYNSKRVTLDSMRISHVYGDCIYIGDGAAKYTSDSVLISNSHFSFTGRQGVAITHGSFITIQNSEFTDVRRTHIDLEPNNVRAVIDHVIIKDNTFLTSRLNWISAAGKGNTRNIFVIGNKLVGKEANVTVGNSKYKNFGPFYFIDNTSSRPMGNPHGSAWRVINVQGFYAEGNNIAVKKGRKMHLVGQSNSTNIILKDNKSTDMVGALKDL